MKGLHVVLIAAIHTPIFCKSLQDIVIEAILDGKNIVQGPLLLELLFVGIETMSPSIH